MQKLKTFLRKIILENKYFWPLTFLTFILARITVWLYPFDSDHWIFYYVGRKFAEGGTMYVSAFDHKPPIIFAFNGLLHLLFGGNLVWHRSFLTLFALLDIYLFWLLLKTFVPKLNLKNPILTLRIGFLLYVFLRSIALLANSGNNTENIGLIFFLLLLLLFFRYQEKRKLFLLLLAGICLSFLFLLKGNFILLALPVVFLLAIEKGETFGRWLLECFLLGIPVLLHLGVWLLYFWQRKAVYDFLVGAFLFSAKYSRVAWSGNLSNNPNLPLSVSIFLLIFIPFLILYFINFKKHQNKYSLFIALYLLTAAVITFGVGPAYPYYFLIALPILVLLAVTTMEDIAGLPASFRYSIYFVLFIGLAGSYAISGKQVYNSFAGPVKAELDEYKQVAEYVDAKSEQTDKIFNYDYGAMFYRLSERDSGTRFISASIPLLDYRDHFDFNFNGIFTREMTESKAKFVVLNKNSRNIYYQNQPLIDYFNQKYETVKEFEHFKVMKIK